MYSQCKCILFFSRTKRNPFRQLLVSFLLLVIKDVYHVMIDGAYLLSNLIFSMGMDANEALIIVLWMATIPSMSLSAFATVLLLVAIIQFYKESKITSLSAQTGERPQNVE